MPGPHIPPAVPNFTPRRPVDYQYQYPSQTPPPIYYQPPPYHGYPAQWHPPYYISHPGIYARPLTPVSRQNAQYGSYQYPPSQQHAPIVVSSQPHAPVNTRPLYVQSPAQHTSSSSTSQSQRPHAVGSPPTPTSISACTPPHSSVPLAANFVTSPPPEKKHAFQPELPWYSVPGVPFPPRAPSVRRRRRAQQTVNDSVELPMRDENNITPLSSLKHAPTADSSLAVSSDTETPATSEATSETGSTQPTTPSSTFPVQQANAVKSQPLVSHNRTVTKPAVPIIPITPKVSNNSASNQKAAEASDSTRVAQQNSCVFSSNEEALLSTSSKKSNPDAEKVGEALEGPISHQPKEPPKSWADLVRRQTSQKPEANVISNGNESNANGASIQKSGSLGYVLQSFSVPTEVKLSFLEPRGLVNTGNMCYMNSILQVLIFCVPFYEFLKQVSKRAIHKFKSDTPLLDAMIMFMQEFSVIDSATSAEQLRMRLKESEFEQFGEPVLSEYVYDVINRLPRFSSMRRGHQQDAEEFLGFLLEGLHEECANVLRTLSNCLEPDSRPPTSYGPKITDDANHGWHEVGPKQKAAITRSSGTISFETPITKIFGGKLRSELRVPGLKNSVTLEPYQPLQLDIGANNVHSITDALKGLTRPETLQGDFNSPHGPGTTATKQVFIETLPPVLILHLKRFQYDNTGGTQKIWKHVGYPLELELPKEIFPAAKRNAYNVHGGPPRYRLSAVVYHHGKNAGVGHYTVDVRRQDGHEWIRMDDTAIRRVRSEEVADGRSDKDPAALIAALENHKRDFGSSNGAGPGVGKRGNTFDVVGEDHEVSGNEAEDQKYSKEANGANGGNVDSKGTATESLKATTSDGASAGNRTPLEKAGLRDSKVAYILLYQQIKK